MSRRPFLYADIDGPPPDAVEELSPDESAPKGTSTAGKARGKGALRGNKGRMLQNNSNPPALVGAGTEVQAEQNEQPPSEESGAGSNSSSSGSSSAAASSDSSKNSSEGAAEGVSNSEGNNLNPEEGEGDLELDNNVNRNSQSAEGTRLSETVANRNSTVFKEAESSSSADSENPQEEGADLPPSEERKSAKKGTKAAKKGERASKWGNSAAAAKKGTSVTGKGKKQPLLSYDPNKESLNLPGSQDSSQPDSRVSSGLASGLHSEERDSSTRRRGPPERPPRRPYKPFNFSNSSKRDSRVEVTDLSNVLSKSDIVRLAGEQARERAAARAAAEREAKKKADEDERLANLPSMAEKVSQALEYSLEETKFPPFPRSITRVGGASEDDWIACHVAAFNAICALLGFLICSTSVAGGFFVFISVAGEAQKRSYESFKSEKNLNAKSASDSDSGGPGKDKEDTFDPAKSFKMCDGSDPDPTVERVMWSDVFGLMDQKRALKGGVNASLDSQYQSVSKPPKGILLYGPPGTGKSLIARAVSGDFRGLRFGQFDSSQINSKWQGQTSKNMDRMFTVAGEQIPTVVFLDEMENMFPTEKDGGHDAEGAGQKDALEMFLVHMSGAKEKDGVLCIGATNYPWRLPIAVRSRFSLQILLPLPTAEEIAEQVCKTIDRVYKKCLGRDPAKLKSISEPGHIFLEPKINGVDLTNEKDPHIVEISRIMNERRFSSREVNNMLKAVLNDIVRAYRQSRIQTAMDEEKEGEMRNTSHMSVKEKGDYFTEKERKAKEDRAKGIAPKNYEEPLKPGSKHVLPLTIGDITAAVARVTVSIEPYMVDNYFRYRDGKSILLAPDNEETKVIQRKNAEDQPDDDGNNIALFMLTDAASSDSDGSSSSSARTFSDLKTNPEFRQQVRNKAIHTAPDYETDPKTGKLSSKMPMSKDEKVVGQSTKLEWTVGGKVSEGDYLDWKKIEAKAMGKG